MPRPSRPHAAAVLAAGAGLILALSACSPSSGTAGPSPTGSGLPDAHVHGLSVSSETGQVLLATHDGLFDVSKKLAVKIGPTNDLMGFTAAMDDGVFYASGHPGAGSDLPSPLGLVKTSDGGKTWEKLSRQGESDFHALTATKSGIVGFDGSLRASPDGTTWNTVPADFVPAILAGNPTSDTVLATTQDGVQRSTDGGATWALDKTAPVIQFAAFASATEAVGVEPGGTVHYSADGGATWTRKGQISGAVQAVAATEGSDGNPRVWAATSSGVVVSTDGGATFRPSDAD
ncbi:sialidase family protein [Arthrobacter sp. AL08]|uniref:F510_1955 family glycosylhydrolase n=1 Tax=unclassified Arthrobacter TaxID=235627 RepID=UPI00249C51B3|nr:MULTISPECIES: sialidase family protein [unclassified Arthrobacter]MDI3243268.1 sialidase family protein [Arthrobacter sp. AL05]MDI3279294.1 sialidase family protein [Arthrobacter sp. AL08]